MVVSEGAAQKAFLLTCRTRPDLDLSIWLIAFGPICLKVPIANSDSSCEVKIKKRTLPKYLWIHTCQDKQSLFLKWTYKKMENRIFTEVLYFKIKSKTVWAVTVTAYVAATLHVYWIIWTFNPMCQWLVTCNTQLQWKMWVNSNKITIS